MAIIEIEGLAKSYRVYQKQEGLLASVRGLFHREYREVAGGPRHRSEGRSGRVRRLSRPQRRRQDHHAQAALGRDHAHARHGPRDGPRALEARERLSPPVRPGDGAEEPALVGPAGAGVVPAAPADLSASSRRQFERRRDELVDLLDVRQLLGQPVRELSLGERMKMELIAALLHSPEVLFLDEPTIGLDVVAQHNIQKFLRHYQQLRQMTMLLTSHYMKDVAALCRRVVIIAHGQIMYDGSLSGIIDRFSGHKVITLVFPGDTMPQRPGTIWRSAGRAGAQGQAAGRSQRRSPRCWPRCWRSTRSRT